MDKQALKFRGCAACSAGRTGNKGYSEGFFDRSNKKLFHQKAWIGAGVAELMSEPDI